MQQRIEDIIRNEILRNLVTYERGGAKSEYDWRLTLEALGRLKSYRLAKDGVATYAQQGIPTFNGILPCYILEEHRIISMIMGNAVAQKAAEEKARNRGR
ncbi:MAG: hypothetical protein GY928_34025 [Colwellia sp.]|nr:hypothetical protein [Colwellia sp.]